MRRLLFALLLLRLRETVPHSRDHTNKTYAVQISTHPTHKLQTHCQGRE